MKNPSDVLDTTKISSGNQSEEFSNLVRLELYKSLRADSLAIQKDVGSIWVQKFIFIGAIIAFALASPSALHVDRPDHRLAVLAATVAVVAVLLDLRILELSIHLRQISSVLRIEFQDVPSSLRCEARLSGELGGRSGMAAFAREWLGFIVTAVPTFIVIVLLPQIWLWTTRSKELISRAAEEHAFREGIKVGACYLFLFISASQRRLYVSPQEESLQISSGKQKNPEKQ